MRALALAVSLVCAALAAQAQGVAPGGPVGGSTGIGIGIGPGTGAGSTGPSWPNGTSAPPAPPVMAPGGTPLPTVIPRATGHGDAPSAPLP